MAASEASRGESLSVLLLCDDDPDHASTLLEHIDSLRRLSRHRVRTLNPRGIRRFRFLDLGAFDVVIVHYSLFLLSDHYVPRELREKLRQFGGVKVQFVQDDYRRVDAMCEAMREIGIDVLFTLVPERELDTVWTEDRLPGVRKVTTLAGYVSEAAVRYPSPALEARGIDVGYRGRTLPYWLGILGQEKAWIAQEFSRRCGDTGLRCDLGWRESDRIYGRSWFDFVAGCRVTLGTESGSTITDFDGALERRTDEYLLEHPGADFWTVHRELLEPYEGNVRMNIVSPRIFEAIALRTGLVLYPGEYSGVIEPEKHYIPLEKDFANFDEVVATIRDADSLRAMNERAYADVVESGRYSYQRLVSQFDSIVDEQIPQKAARGSAAAAFAETNLRQFARRTLEKPRGQAVGLAIGAAAVVADDPEMWPLAGAWVRDSRLRRAVSARGLVRDVVRLAIIRRAQAGRLSAGIPFAVEPELRAGDDVLVLRSSEVRDRDWQAPDVEPAELEAIVWDHSAVQAVEHPITSWWWAHIRNGRRDVHEFEALRALAEHDPELVSHVLRPVLAQPLPQDPIPAEPDPAPLVLRAVRSPGTLGPKALLVLRAATSVTPLRRLVAASLRRRSGLDLVLNDVLKLELLHGTISGELVDTEGVAVEATFDPADGALTLATRAGAAPAPTVPAVAPAGVRRLVWDHRGLMNEVRLKEPDIVIGLNPSGFHEFAGLQQLLTSAPREVAAAIAYLLEPLTERVGR